MLCCAALYCCAVLLHCTALHCTVLYFTTAVLYCTVLYSKVLCLLYCTAVVSFCCMYRPSHFVLAPLLSASFSYTASHRSISYWYQVYRNMPYQTIPLLSYHTTHSHLIPFRPILLHPIPFTSHHVTSSFHTISFHRIPSHPCRPILVPPLCFHHDPNNKTAVPRNTPRIARRTRTDC